MRKMDGNKIHKWFIELIELRGEGVITDAELDQITLNCIRENGKP